MGRGARQVEVRRDEETVSSLPARDAHRCDEPCETVETANNEKTDTNRSEAFAR
jgi:hypothetical protein